ncbi:MAG: M23 family metallopeptidase [Acidobacteria bacterium]|nr:M23 family metallopeptidase [Acidobacteriota bacterium]
MEGGLGRGIYAELFDQEVARAVAREGPLGISDIILRELANDALVSKSGGAKVRETPATERPAQRTSPCEQVPDFCLPVSAPVTSVFGPRIDPIDGATRLHRGIDLAAPAGTSVCAALGGRVAYAGPERGYGNTVLIEHGGGLQTRYAHLGTIGVKAGKTVVDGESIGTVGSTGRSTGPHLHFEVRRFGRAMDPVGFMGE